jgi:hypothetical protein
LDTRFMGRMIRLGGTIPPSAHTAPTPKQTTSP